MNDRSIAAETSETEKHDASPRSDAFVVPCTIRLEQTADALYAYVELDGCDVGPGDWVQVLDAPTSIPFGQSASYARRAMVRRAGLLRRVWAHIEGYLELTELFEVSFSEGRAR